MIEVHGEGVFNVRAAGSWTGGGASFVVLNHGLVNKETASTSELGGTYVNVSGTSVNISTTHVKAGTLKHGGKVQVSSGVYKVDAGATAWVRGWTDGLRAYNGTLTGGGTVDGNVNLGFFVSESDTLPPGVQTNGGRIHPIANQTITIKGGLRMRSTGSEMRIDFDANGNFSKVDVQDTVYLNGTLYVDKDGGFNPGAGEFTFLTAAANPDDFATTIYSPPSWYADAPASAWRSFHKKKVGNTYVLEVIDPNAPPGGGGGGGVGGGDEDTGGSGTQFP